MQLEESENGLKPSTEESPWITNVFGWHRKQEKYLEILAQIQNRGLEEYNANAKYFRKDQKSMNYRMGYSPRSSKSNLEEMASNENQDSSSIYDPIMVQVDDGEYDGKEL